MSHGSGLTVLEDTNKNNVVMAPGPASSGNASGKTETSCLCMASSCSVVVVERRPDWRGENKYNENQKTKTIDQ